MLWDWKKAYSTLETFSYGFFFIFSDHQIEFFLSLSNRGNREQGYYCNSKALSMFPIIKFGYYQNEHEFYSHLSDPSKR